MTQSGDQHLNFIYVERVVRRVIPKAEDSVTVSATKSIQECATRFLTHFTKEASKLCAEEQRNEITGDDILWVMFRSGFQQYAKPLRTYLAKYRMSRVYAQLDALDTPTLEPQPNAPASAELSSAEVIELDEQSLEEPLMLLPEVDRSESHTAALLNNQDVRPVSQAKPMYSVLINPKTPLRLKLKALKAAIEEAQNPFQSPDTTTCSIANKKLAATTSDAMATKSEHRMQLDCPICGKALGSEKSLKAHIQALHDGILYACPFCDFQIGYLQKLQSHVQKNHSDQTFDKCAKCVSRFDGRYHFFGKQHLSTCMMEHSFVSSTQREDGKTRIPVARNAGRPTPPAVLRRLLPKPHAKAQITRDEDLESMNVFDEFFPGCRR